MMRVIVVEDEPLLAELLTDSLNAHGEIAACDYVESGTRALTDVNPAEWDAAVLDIDLGPGPDGVEVAKSWRAANPTLGLVFMTHVIEPMALVLGGGLAYLPKRRATTMDALLECVRVSAAGGVMVHPEISNLLPSASGALAELSAHQQRILREIASGASNKKIGEDLGINVKSVENATAQALRTLGIDGTDQNVNVRVLAALTYLRLASERR
jgi:DNA-binding NarL/FixJ family response regulator